MAEEPRYTRPSTIMDRLGAAFKDERQRRFLEELLIAAGVDPTLEALPAALTGANASKSTPSNQEDETGFISWGVNGEPQRTNEENADPAP